jgi:hypothetical protein
MLVVVVVVVMVVVVMMPPAGELEHGEAQAGGDQDRPNDRVLGALDR